MYSSKLEGYTIEYTDQKEFEIIKKEIFKNQIYAIDLDNKEPIIIDAGAHIGLSIVFFKLLYPNSKITAFEPNPLLAPILEKNMNANAIDNVGIINKALDTQDGSKSFYIDNDGTWLSTGSYLPNAWKGISKTQEIKVETTNAIDAFESVLQKNKSDKIDLLKMDIEGYEYTLLKYLNKNNKLSLIKNLIFEYHPSSKNNLGRLMELLDIMSKNFKNIAFIQEGRLSAFEDLNIENLFMVKCCIM